MPCVNKEGSLVWVKEGNSLAQHARSVGLHNQCNDSCPVWPVFRDEKHRKRVSLVGFTHKDICRDATIEEIKKYLTKKEADEELLRLGIVGGSTQEAGPSTQW